MTGDKTFFSALPGEITLVDYKSTSDKPVPDSVYVSLEEQLNNTEDIKTRKKRFFFVAVECIQNIIRHQEGKGPEEVCIMAFSSPGNYYRIATGNHVARENAGLLKKQLDELMELDDTQLHERYRNKLSENSISEKGGAGLGLIEIARKSDNIKYYMKEEETFTFFSIEVTVK
jgi:hypothetical protein